VAASGFLQLSVADDGVGIRPAGQDKLFSRFFSDRGQRGRAGLLHHPVTGEIP
jgi:signal transduction histidine kinase